MATILQPDEGTVFGTQIAARPAGGGESTVQFSDLPAVQVRIDATAHPNADGTGTTLASGSVTVNVPEAGTAQETLTLQSVVAAVSLDPASLSISVSGAAGLRAEARDADDAVVLTAASDWEWSSDDPSIATVDGSDNPALVSGVAAGSTTVTARHVGSGLSADAEVLVGSTSVSSVFLEPEGAQVRVGQTLMLEAFAQNDDGILPTRPSDWQWTTNDASIATVDGSTNPAVVTGVARGTSSITAQHLASGKFTFQTTEVEPADDSEVTDVSIDQESLLLEVDETATVKAFAFDDNGRVSTIPNDFEWTSSNRSVATVARGYNPTTVTGVAVGDSQLTVRHRASGKSATISVSVGPATDRRRRP